MSNYHHTNLNKELHTSNLLKFCIYSSLKTIYVKSQLWFKHTNVIVGNYISIKISFIINLILILNQGGTHHLCILLTHLSSLVYYVSFQLISTLIGVVAHVRERTFTIDIHLRVYV